MLAVAPSPVVALNRAIGIGQRDGASEGLRALREIDDRERLARYPFYPAAMREMEMRRGHRNAAAMHFRAALGLARNAAERRFIERRLGSRVDG